MSRAEILKLQKRVQELEQGRDGSASSGLGANPSTVGADLYQDMRHGAMSYAFPMPRTNQQPHSPLDEAAENQPDATRYQMQRTPHFVGDSPTSNPVSGVSTRSPESTRNRPMSISASGMIGSVPGEGEDESQEYFGGSSAGSFINQVRLAVKQKMRQTGPILPNQQSAPSSRQQDSVPQMKLYVAPDFVLPARRQADRLLNIYWDIVHVLYPFLDKAETIRKYQNLWTGENEDENDSMFVCILNVIFALSCQLNDTIEAERREQSAKMYYQRAKDLLDLWSSGTFESVQAYLILGQYFQSTNEPHQCWMVIGAAIRTAQSLGIHLPETTERIKPI